MLKKIFQKLLGQLLLAVVAFALLVWATLHLLDYYTDHGKYIVVPDLTKKTLTEVQLLFEKEHLRYEPNERVKENRKIYLNINPTGYHKVTVPKVIQVTRRNAEATLQSVGLTIGNITYVDDIGKDMVLELQYNGKPVLPGEKLVKTSRIDLICGNGLENKENDSIPNEIPIEELIGE